MNAMPARREKWITLADEAEPAGGVAARVLAARLQTAWNFFCLAATRPQHDIEHVHQARVWSRRAIAALDMFDELLPGRRKSVQRRLKQMRRAAGDARDDDVLIERLALLAERQADPDRGAAWLLESVRRHREQSQQPLDKLHRRLERKKFPKRLGKLVARVRWRGRGPEPEFRALCRARMQAAVKRFLKQLDADLDSPAALHALRIRAKQLRYTMELAADTFPPDFRQQLYPQVEQLQQRLGEVNDHATAAQRFARWRAKTRQSEARATLGEMIRQEEDALAAARAGLFAWWTPSRAERLRRELQEI